LFQDEPIVMILKSVISLRSFNHEFPRFEKKHDPWSDPTNKNTPTSEINRESMIVHSNNRSGIQ